MRVEFVSVLEQDNLLKTHLNIFLKEKKKRVSNSPNFRVCG